MNMIYKAIDWITESTLRTGAGLSVLFIFGVVVASAAQTTSWDVTNNPQMYLDASITASQTTNIKLSALQRNGETVIFPNSTGGVLRIRQGTRVEDISFTGATVNSTTKVVTLAGVTRNICWNIADRLVSCGNGYSFSKGAITELSIDARLLNFKLNKDRVNWLTGSGQIAGTGTGQSILDLPCVTSTQRDNMTNVTDGNIICNSTLGTFQYRSGGAWISFGSGSTNNASDTLAGKVQIITLAEQLARTATGSTGAQNVLTPRWLVKNASGSLSAGLIPQLGSDGKLSTSFINSPIGSGFFGDGSDGAVTISTATTLTRDMMYSTLTVNTGAYINTAGFRVFVNGTLTLYGSTGSIIRNGNDGGNGSNAVTTTGGAGGASGAVLVDGLLMGGIRGSMGGRGGSAVNNGDGNPGIPGNPGGLQGKAVGSNGAAGVAGSAGGQDDDASGAVGVGGSGGAAGTVSLHPALYGSFRFLQPATSNRLQTLTGSVVYYINAASGGGGGGGAGSCNGEGSNSAGGGGGGGGSGGNAGVNVVFAKIIRGTGHIQAIGGSGGSGGSGAAASSTCGGGGGGAGGSGGNGGLAVLVYGSSTWTGTVSAAGGAGGSGGSAGAGGTGAQPGSAGSSGTTGVSGVALTFVLSQ